MLARFNRREFFGERWDYQPGEQVFIAQPTQSGKTRFLWDLAMATPHRRPPVAAIAKPRDPTPALMTRAHGWKEVRSWPPPQRMPWQSEPPGYTLWPRHSLSLDPAAAARNRARIKAELMKVMLWTYKQGDQVLLLDEILDLLNDGDLREQLLDLSNKGSGMNAAIWYADQKAGGTIGRPMPSPLLNNPVHLFFGYDPVAANRKTISQIAGINTGLVLDEVSNLQVVPTKTPYGIKPISELLYCNKNGPRGGYMCIVETQ
jgi:hypothetical protein